MSSAVCNERFQSSPSMQRETEGRDLRVRILSISILSLYAEGDPRRLRSGEPAGAISILSLYAEGDYIPLKGAQDEITFQSSPSMQRETNSQAERFKAFRFQSSPSMQRETLYMAESYLFRAFQSSPSMQRETQRK